MANRLTKGHAILERRIKMTEFKPTGFGAKIFQERYSFDGKETWEEACRRVARVVAVCEKPEIRQKVEDKFYEILVNGLFSPGGRIWYGAGRSNFTLSNCFVLPMGDSKEGWAKVLSDSLITSAYGGGIGMNGATIRPSGAAINNSRGTSSGPLSVFAMVDSMGEHIKAGGSRRMAIMDCLDIQHPNIIDFVNSKIDKTKLVNANISVVMDEISPERFFEMVKNGEDLELKFNNKVYGKISTTELFDKICENAFKNGEPGFLNGAYANRDNNASNIAHLRSTNPSMPGETLVLTDKGICQISSLENKTFKTRTLTGEWAEARCFLSGNNEPIYKISFSKNIKTYATKEHKWPTINHQTKQIIRKSTNELKRGDLLLLNHNQPLGIDLDPSLTEEDGFFLGYLMGDGWVGKRKTGKNKNSLFMGFIFSDKDLLSANRILEYVNTRKLHKNHITSRHDNKEHNIQITDQTFIQTVITRFGIINKNRLPTTLWKSNDNFIRGFVDGIFSSDGHVDKNGKYLLLTSSRKTFIEEISKLLSFYGITGSICSRKVLATFPNGKDYNKLYNVNHYKIHGNQAKRFCNIFNISQPDKKKRLEIAANRKTRRHLEGTIQVEKITKVKRGPVWDINVNHITHSFSTAYSYTGNCGEIWLFDYDSCNLGSVILPRFVDENKKINWEKLQETVRWGTRFLDNIISVNTFPLVEQKEIAQNFRRIGLGIMGLAEYLILSGFKYSNSEAFVKKTVEKIRNASYDESVNLSIEKGAYPKCNPEEVLKSPHFASKLPIYIKSRIALHGMRNVATLMIAPTGTTSLMFGVTGGLEPMYATAYWRNYYVSDKIERELIINPLFESYIKQNKDTELFETALDLSLEDHLKMQATLQEYVDNSISKTIMIPQNMDYKKFQSLIIEWLPKLKGLTLYPEGSRELQPITPMTKEEAIKAIKQGTNSIIGTEDGCIKGSCDIY